MTGYHLPHCTRSLARLGRQPSQTYHGRQPAGELFARQVPPLANTVQKETQAGRLCSLAPRSYAHHKGGLSALAPALTSRNVCLGASASIGFQPSVKHALSLHHAWPPWLPSFQTKCSLSIDVESRTMPRVSLEQRQREGRY